MIKDKLEAILGEAEHDKWFAAEYPQTHRDMKLGIMSALVIFAHSYVAWIYGIKTTLELIKDHQKLRL